MVEIRELSMDIYNVIHSEYRHSDPHSIPVGGGNAPIRCLPTANKTKEEEEISVDSPGLEQVTENVDCPRKSVTSGHFS